MARQARIDAKEIPEPKSPKPFACLVYFVGRLRSLVPIGVLDVTVLRQPIVVAMSANPFPEETVSYKTPYRAITEAHARRQLSPLTFLNCRDG
jgi:hypothetical protein